MLNMDIILSVCYQFPNVWITTEHSLNDLSTLSCSVLAYMYRIHGFGEVIFYKFLAGDKSKCRSSLI